MRYNRFVRWVLLRLSDYILEERILDYLYPEDCEIVFAEEEA